MVSVFMEYFMGSVCFSYFPISIIKHMLLKSLTRKKRRIKVFKIRMQENYFHSPIPEFIFVLSLYLMYLYHNCVRFCLEQYLKLSMILNTYRTAVNPTLDSMCKEGILCWMKQSIVFPAHQLNV